MRPRVVARPYAAGDRSAVRDIVCETADHGEPIERFFRDRDSFADFMTVYYTDHEPQSVWVAACDGRVVGYLTGCHSSHRYQRVMLWQVMPHAVLRALQRGAFWSGDTWRMLWAGFRTWVRGGFERHRVLARYPAHLHINLRKGFRGYAVGSQLLRRFIEQARAAGVRGIHASVSGGNLPARRFFEREGFMAVGRHPVIRPDTAAGRLAVTVTYGKAL